MDVETSTVEGTTSGGVTENEKEPSESAPTKADAQPKAEDNEVTMSSAHDSNVMPTQKGSSSYVSPSGASAPEGNDASHGTSSPSVRASSASPNQPTSSEGPSASAQGSSSQPAAPSQGVGVSTAGLNGSGQVLWPSGPGGPWSATLTTGLDDGGIAMLECATDDWRKALTSGDMEKYQQFLRKRRLPTNDNPLEATALEHGFIPEASGTGKEADDQPSHTLHTWSLDQDPQLI